MAKSSSTLTAMGKASSLMMEKKGDQTQPLARISPSISNGFGNSAWMIALTAAVEGGAPLPTRAPGGQ